MGSLWDADLVGYRSGQTGLAVNQLSYDYEGSNPSPTTTPLSIGSSIG